MTEHWAGGVADVRRTLERHPEIFQAADETGVRVIDAGHHDRETTSPAP